MPAALRYIPLNSNSREAIALNTTYQAERKGRIAEINAAWDYYRGVMKKHLNTDNTKVDDNVTLPMVGTLIDKGVASMIGVDDRGVIEGVKFEIQGADESQASAPPSDPLVDDAAIPAPESQETTEPPVAETLEELWDANKKNKFLYNLFLAGGLAGHHFVKIIPDALPDPNGGGTRYPRYVLLDPRNVSVFWAEDDVERVLWYRIETGMRCEDIVRNVDDAGEDAGGWSIITYEKKTQASHWKPVGAPEQWERDWSPVVDWQNLPVPSMGGYYGKNDLGVLGLLNDAINFATSNMQRIQKHHGHPTLVATGVKLPEDFTAGPDRIIDTETAEAKVYYVEMASEGEYTLALIQFLQRVFYNGGREVDPSTVADKLGDLTNFGIRMMYHDSMIKRQSKWLTAAEGLELLCRYGLELMGFPATTRVNIIPPDVLPQDELEQANALSIDRSAGGISETTYQERRGYDPEKEAENNEVEQAKKIAHADAMARTQLFTNVANMSRNLRRQQNDEQTQPNLAGNGAAIAGRSTGANGGGIG